MGLRNVEDLKILDINSENILMMFGCRKALKQKTLKYNE